MTSAALHGFGVEIQNLKSVIANHSETADDTSLSALDFAARIVDRASAALEAADAGGTWLQLTGAIDFMSASGIAIRDLDRIRTNVDSLLEAA